MTGFEPAASCSQSRRATNCATPGYSVFYSAGRILPNVAPYQLSHTRIFNFRHYTTARAKIKDFSVCGHSCGQSRFYTAFDNRRKSSKRRCHKALRGFALPCPGYRHGTPKAGALPTALHPVISLFYSAGRILPNQARYQLRYTRIFSFCHYTTARGEKQSFFSLRSFMCAIHIG